MHRGGYHIGRLGTVAGFVAISVRYCPRNCAIGIARIVSGVVIGHIAEQGFHNALVCSRPTEGQRAGSGVVLHTPARRQSGGAQAVIGL